jgi:hypothetical protein
MENLIFESDDSFRIYEFWMSHGCLFLAGDRCNAVLKFIEMDYFEAVAMFVQPKLFLVAEEKFNKNLDRLESMRGKKFFLKDIHGVSRICAARVSLLLNPKRKIDGKIELVSNEWSRIA